MNVPDAAIGEAAAAIQFVDRSNLTRTARVAIEAAMPAIREALAQEIDHARKLSGDRGEWVDGMYAAARIVRGGTP